MQHEHKERIEKMVDEFSNLCNTFSDAEVAEAFIKQFCKQHRTLQQTMMRTMLRTIEFVGSEAYSTDGRNENSKVVAKDMIAGWQKVTAKKFNENPDTYTFKPSQFLPYI